MTNPYDQVTYRTFPRRQTHPDRLAAIARFFGMSPAPVTRCRVLEIGCGTGANLIPMAFHLPCSRFTGIDLAAAPVAAGSAMAADLGLNNIDLRVADLCDFGEGEGEFDYIFAHGLYSWIPPVIRDRLLAVCGARLAPHGVAFVSYNVYPGRYPRQMLREILLYHLREVEDPSERVSEARRLLAQIDHPEAKALMEQGDDTIFHDDLAPFNDPVWFRDFAAHAQRHGLQYLGEADSHKTFDPSLGQMAAADVVEREQYVDFLNLRRFRQSLLCRQENVLDRSGGAARMDEFLFSENSAAHRIPGGDPVLEAVAQALHDTSPLPAAFEELTLYAGGAERLRELLYALLATGCVNLHVHDFPCEESVNERPRASRLARYQAESGTVVTSACHVPVQLDAIAARLVRLLDGTRNHHQLACDLAGTEGAPGLEEIRRHLPGSLDWLARMALLEG